MGNNRESDSVPLKIKITDEDIAVLERMMYDEYIAEVNSLRETMLERECEELRMMIVTGISYWGQRLTNRSICRLKKEYESLSGERLDVDKECELHREEYLDWLTTMLTTGISPDGTVLSGLRLKRIRDAYASISGRKFGEDVES